MDLTKKLVFIKHYEDFMSGKTFLNTGEFYDYCVAEKLLFPIKDGFSSSTIQAIYEGTKGNKKEALFCLKSAIDICNAHDKDQSVRVKWVRKNIEYLTGENAEYINRIVDPRPATFFVVNGEVFAFNHNRTEGQKLILPIRECNQFRSKDFQPVMLAAESDLKGRTDGVWSYLTHWVYREFLVPELIELNLVERATIHSRMF